jgi:glucokinase
MAMLVVGIDLGGTEIKAGLVDEKKGIIKKISRPTEVEMGNAQVIANITKTVKELTENTEFSAIGIGSPGSIDRKNGIVRFSPNFPNWRNFELVRLIKENINVDVFLENDANAFALGEWYFGKAKGLHDFIALTIGTGIGSGVVCNNTFLTGKDGLAPELGHVVVVPNGPQCGCGNRGCVEATSSAKYIALEAKNLLDRYPDSLVLKLAGKKEKIESKHVFQAYEKNDPLATVVCNFAIDALARAIGGYVHAFNPEKIIIGGGLSRAGDALFVPLREMTKKYVMSSFADTYTIEQSSLVEDAGILGAASAAFYAKENPL